jgi:DNA-directed RNA polymerase specialized sigma subunit
MTTEEVRFLLENRADVVNAIGIMSHINRETSDEIAEAICLAATCYDKDRVQSNGDGDTLTQTVARIGQERIECNRAYGEIRFMCETKERQLRDLDRCREKLLPIAQGVIKLRFDEGRTVAETALEWGTSPKSISRITTENIRVLARMMTRKGW